MARDFDQWIADNAGKVYRIWEKTDGDVLAALAKDPGYLEDLARGKISRYEEDECKFVTFEEAIALPDGDYLVGVREADGSSVEYIEYIRLSALSIAYSDSDQD
jgi:hypothetical protein